MKYRKYIAALLAVILAVSTFFGAADARAASSNEIKNQIERLEKEEAAIAEELERLQQESGENQEELEQIVAQKYNIDRQIALLYEQIGSINEQIAAYNLLIADRQDDLDAAQFRYDELVEQNKDRIRAMEEQGSLNYWSVLFKASSFSDLLDRMNMIQEIQNADKRRLEELDAAAREVEQVRQTLLRDKDSLKAVRQRLDEIQAALETKRQEADVLIAKLWEKGEEYERFILEAEEEQERLMQQIADKEAELEEAEYQEWLATYVPPTESTTRPSTGGSGESGAQIPSGDGTQWRSPLTSYRLTSPFGMRLHPVDKVWKMHNGVDMAASRGTPIYASRSGKVTAATSHWSMGEYVTINHGDGFSSIYMHMDHYIVSAGDYVTAGQLIGYVGDSGVTSGPHLHFGISYKGEYVNPMEYLN